MIISCGEKTVLDECQHDTNIRECIGKQQGGAEIFDCVLDDSADKGVLDG